MPNNKKIKGKHRQPKTTNLFVPPAAPKQPVPKKYGWTTRASTSTATTPTPSARRSPRRKS